MIGLVLAAALAAAAAPPPSCPMGAKSFAGHCVQPEQAVMDLGKCGRGVIEWKMGSRAPTCVPCGAKRPTPAEQQLCPEVERQSSAEELRTQMDMLTMSFPKHASPLQEEQHVWELKRDGTCQGLQGDGDSQSAWASCQDKFNRERLQVLQGYPAAYAKTEKPAKGSRAPGAAPTKSGKKKRHASM